MGLKRDILSPNRYQYLSKEDSELYDTVKDSGDPKDITIKGLLEQKAGASKSTHCSSNY